MNSALLQAVDEIWDTKRRADLLESRPRFPLVRLRDLEPELDGQYVVDGLLPRATLVVVWGPPKCGKSFWTLDLVAHIATGAPYRGCDVEQGAVVYVVAEGAKGFKARAKAWCEVHLAAEDDPPLHVLEKRVDLINDHRALIADIAAQLGDGVRLGTVVIDTVNRTLNGSESSDQDMTAYVNAADAIKEAFGCIVIVIHHCGHQANRPRGHTALAGAADVQISIRMDLQGLITAKVDWAKDMADGYSDASRLEQVTVGTDVKGKPLTTCIIRPSTAAAPQSPRGPRLSAMQTLAMKALDNALAVSGAMRTLPGMPDGGAASVPTAIWRQTFYDMSLLDDLHGNLSARQKAFRRASLDLQARELIGCACEHVWKVRGR